MIEQQEKTTLSLLAKIVDRTVNRYLAAMAGQEITNLHELVLEQIEEPLFKIAIRHFKYNQSQAARALGISRGTLRTKLKYYFGDQYCSERDEKK